VDSRDPRQQLARYLRALREDRWPGRRITQPQLAQALGGVSVPLISSWESQSNPRVPPLQRLDAYALLFATARSFDGDSGQVISSQDMSDDEQQVMSELRTELTQLRNAALRAGAETPQVEHSSEVEDSLSSGPWRFADGNDITIVCARWPDHMLSKIPYTSRDDPDYIELLTYSELDALFELHGHLRAANPANKVRRRVADQLGEDDYTSHLTTLGGIDWNWVTSSALERLQLPVQQIADWETEGGQYFEVLESGVGVQHRPVLEKSGGREMLREDVALFARAVSPFNRKRTVTICNGMYGRGTYGVVRALTDARFRDRNSDYLKSRFGSSSSYCVLSRVPIENGATLTPDWTLDEFKLFEWSE
jgi:hypothetical protein